MKAIIGMLAAASLVACNGRAGEESARVGGAVDTAITTRTTQDTTVVTRDTTVSVDTTTMKGDKATSVDTTRRTRSSTDTGMRGDTGSSR
jgi:hypothetical protein